MLPFRNTRATTLATILFFSIVAGYAYFEARNILYGPQLVLDTPSQAIIVTEPLIVVRGSAKNIVEIRLNGLPIAVTEAGNFEEPYLLAQGYNTVSLSAIDKLGRTTTKELQVVYTPTETGSPVFEPLSTTTNSSDNSQ